MKGCCMNTNCRWLKQIVRLGLLLLTGGSMSACSATMSWKEEVLLNDGSRVISERFYNLGSFPGFDAHERVPLDETVTFSWPGTNKEIVWKSDFRDSDPEPNSLNLIRFDVVSGVPYIATYPAGCIAYNKWGRPNPPQILFKYAGDQWQRIALEELPPELIGARANVIVGRPATSLLKSFYHVEDVDAKNAPIGTPEYKAILGEAVKGAGSTCMKIDYYGKAGWLSPDWFTNQPTLDACLKFCDRKKIGAESCPCNSIFKRK